LGGGSRMIEIYTENLCASKSKYQGRVKTIDEVLESWSSCCDPWAAPAIVRFVQRNPQCDESAWIINQALKGLERVITYGKMRVPTNAGSPAHVHELACRQYLTEALFSLVEDAKVTMDVGCRNETRIRGSNMWLLAQPKKPWVMSALPFDGHRVTLVADSASRLHAFERKSCSPLGFSFDGTGCPPGFAADVCINSSKTEFIVYDVICDGAAPVCRLALKERLDRCPAHLRRVSYEACFFRDNVRMIFVDPSAPYKFSAKSRDALTWKAPLPADQAVLACRAGQAVSRLYDLFCTTTVEGDVYGEYVQSRCYVCQLIGQSEWKILHEAKRSCPMYTSAQCELVRLRKPQPENASAIKKIICASI